MLGLASEIGVDGRELAAAARKARKVSNTIIEMQVQTLMMRIRTRMNLVAQARRQASASV